MENRWLRSEEIEELVNPELKRKGWAELNLDTCRVLGAFDDNGHLSEFFVLQLFPLLGPLLRVDNEHRDNGNSTRDLVKAMQDYLEKENARGYFAIAENPFTKRLCERFGMAPLEVPVYGFVPTAEAVTR